MTYDPQAPQLLDMIAESSAPPFTELTPEVKSADRAVAEAGTTIRDAVTATASA
jgi:hypothetical protein